MYTIYTRNSLSNNEFVVAEAETGVGPRMVSPNLRLEKNRGGSFEFSVYDDHPLYTNLELINDRILIENNGSRIFCGRAIQENYDWYNKRQVVCEGALAFLSDVVIPYVSSFEDAIEYIEYLIDFYNNSKNKDSRVTTFDRFVIAATPGDTVIKSIEDLTSNGDRYRTVFDLLMELLDFLEWRVVVDYSEADSDIFNLYFYDEAFYVHPFPVKFSENLLDITKDNDMADFATVFYPLGKPKNTNAKKTTIDDHRGTEISAGVSYREYTVILSDGSLKSPDSGMMYNQVLHYTAAFDYLEEGQKLFIRAYSKSGKALYSFVDSSGNPLAYLTYVVENTMWEGTADIPNGAKGLYVYNFTNTLYEENDIMPGDEWGAWVYNTSTGTRGRKLEEYELDSTLLIYNWTYINSSGYVIEDIGDENYRVIDLTGENIVEDAKLIISTKNRKGFGLYAFKDDFDHTLAIRMSDDTPVLTYLKDEVVTIPEGATHLLLGYYGTDGAYKVYKYTNNEDEPLTHIGDDLMVKQVGNIRTVFGHIDGTTGKVIRYSETAVIGAKADSVVYTGIIVEPGKKYVYSGMNRDNHGMVRVRAENPNQSTFLKTAGTELTNLQLFEFEVPEGTICDIGGILGNARTHLWEYVEDNDDNKANYITIESENDGYPYLIDTELISKYGWIEKVHTFEDIETPKILMDKAQKYFADIKKKVDYTYTAKAIDPSLISEYRTYLPGDLVTVKSQPHSVDVEMEVKSVDLRFDSPQSNTYELVYEKK